MIALHNLPYQISLLLIVLLCGIIAEYLAMHYDLGTDIGCGLE